MFTTLTNWAKSLKRNVLAVYFASRDARTPTMAKVVAMAVAAYALSPIDLIPDFIPILGYLDDLLIVPLGLALAIRMIPPNILAEARQRADAASAKQTSYLAAAAVVSIWACLGLAAFFWWRNTTLHS